MKAKYTFLFSILFSITFISVSCTDKKEDDGGGKKPPVTNPENQTANKWIYEAMEFRYFWNEKIPQSSNLDFNIEPDKFFYQTLYEYKKAHGDRFSYLEKDGVPHFYDKAQASNIKKNELGFEFYTLFFNDIGPAYCVTYVKQGTEAEKKLKRGDVIYKVDGQRVTEDNYISLLYSGKPKYSLELYQGETIELKTKESYSENPVYFSDIITTQRGLVGYIVYNFFANDNGDNSMRYALEMNRILQGFKDKNIAHLILDLRYNGGGYVSSGNYIASAIVPNRGSSDTKIYTKRAFNKKYEAQIKLEGNYEARVTEFFQDNITNGRTHLAPVARLEIEKLYVLTSKYTASASEQIINGLRPYINVEVIGQTTTGKNMESYEISSPNKSIKWVLHPLTSVSYNKDAKTPKDNDYSMGFPPSDRVEIDEFEFHSDNGQLSLYPLGNTNEVLLAKAIRRIAGPQNRASSKISTSQVKMIKPKIIGSSLERKRNDMIIEFDNHN